MLSIKMKFTKSIFPLYDVCSPTFLFAINMFYFHFGQEPTHGFLKIQETFRIKKSAKKGCGLTEWDEDDRDAGEAADEHCLEEDPPPPHLLHHEPAKEVGRDLNGRATNDVNKR